MVVCYGVMDIMKRLLDMTVVLVWLPILDEWIRRLGLYNGSFAFCIYSWIVA
jgi:hypothetical protein